MNSSRCFDLPGHNERRLLISVVLGVLSVAALVVPAAASATTDLHGVSCASTTSCMGVGLSDASGSSQGQTVKVTNSTTWADQSTPNPSGALQSDVSSVSCASTTSCLAVGTFVDSANATKPQSMSWNGTSWSSLTTPVPSGASASSLTGISCASTTSCQAVGYYTNASNVKGSFAMGWNGSSWSSEEVPTVSGASAEEVTGVSCYSTTGCMAVGNYVDSSGVTRSLALQWNGTSWAIVSTENPSGFTYSTLQGVSCPSSTYCMAAGFYYDSVGVKKTFVLTWNGSAWSISSTTNPSGAIATQFLGVSCTSSTFCVAVGSYEKSSDELPFSERWNGTSWKEFIPTVENVGAVGAKLEGVSCKSTTYCLGVGSISYGHAATSRRVGFEFESTGWTLVESGGYQRTWAVSDFPEVPGPVTSSLSDVSCPEYGFCMRVGSAGGSETGSSRIKKWNGSAWAVQSAPAPSGATATRLMGVSCSSFTSCKAVGRYTNSSGVIETLGLSWNGTSWSLSTTPSPSGAKSSELLSVSCTSSTACSGVGTYVNSEGTILPLAVSWNGTSWSLQTVPAPTGSTRTELLGISCNSSTVCQAVGNYVSSSTEKTLVESWNGTSWSVTSSPNPSGAKASSLSGISCASSAACVAVGKYTNSSGVTEPLALRWTTSWSEISAAGVFTEGAAREFSGVSCPSSTLCKVVGSYASSSGTRTALTASWTSEPVSTWTKETLSGYHGAPTALAKVSCSSTIFCTSVGLVVLNGSSPADFAYKRTETGWSVSDPSSSYDTLAGITCTTSDSCIAVGKNQVGASQETQSWSWAGESGWSLLSMPSVSEGALNGIGCSESSACTAVGTQSGTSAGSLAERWNGTSWTVQTTPNPSGSSEATFNGVACPTSTFCLGVGKYRTSSNPLNALAETWNGTSWSLQTLPLPTGTTWNWLTGVSCSSASFCMAVGNYKLSTGNYHPLVEKWNGTSWTVQTPSEPSGATQTSLSAVSCTGTTNCIAVGNYNTEKGEFTLATRWNGSTWAVQTTPNASGYSTNMLTGVSCYTSSRCVAVGVSENEEYRPLALGLVGETWTIESTPSPTGVPFVSLNAVSCKAAADCISAGWSQTGEVAVPMAEYSQEPNAGGGQAIVVETEEALPSLTQKQEEKVIEEVKASPAVQAAVSGASYEIVVGPWLETTAEGTEVLVGAGGEIVFTKQQGWEEWKWPVVGYSQGMRYEYGSYTNGLLPTTVASNIETMDFCFDAEFDKTGEVLGGEVVELQPEATPETSSSVTIAPGVEETSNSEEMGY